jgi:hypothetical protein
MKWLARLKNQQTPGTHATEPTEPGCVGFVAHPAGTLQKFEATHCDPANDTPTNPDRWCWPQSDAMNRKEIDTFTARLARFTDNGLSLEDAEGQADQLLRRDRDGDDRRLCLECSHLQGAGHWRCGNWQGAGLAIRVADATLPSELTLMLQRCDGFNDIHHQGGRNGEAKNG